jgi:RimJ/RimL family protein N-acetyltransferase
MNNEVRLRPVAEEDLDLLHEWHNDPAVAGEYEWHGWVDLQWLRRGWDENRMRGEDSGMLMVALGDDTLGFVGWGKRLTGYRSFCWTIGALIAAGARGRGHGAAAQRLLAGYLFAHTQMARIEATTEVANTAEQRALEKAGFTREGVLRAVHFRDGQWRDDVMYSMLRHEAGRTPE